MNENDSNLKLFGDQPQAEHVPRKIATIEAIEKPFTTTPYFKRARRGHNITTEM